MIITVIIITTTRNSISLPLSPFSPLLFGTLVLGGCEKLFIKLYVTKTNTHCCLVRVCPMHAPLSTTAKIHKKSWEKKRANCWMLHIIKLEILTVESRPCLNVCNSKLIYVNLPSLYSSAYSSLHPSVSFAWLKSSAIYYFPWFSSDSHNISFIDKHKYITQLTGHTYIYLFINISRRVYVPYK